MSETTTFRIITRPEVHVCCLKCEAEGRRHGAWVPIDEVDEVGTDAIHRGRVVTLDRDVDLHVDTETAVLESRNLPVDGPLTPAKLEAWQAVYEAVGEADWAAFLAWVNAGAYAEDGDRLPSSVAFQECYAGGWADFEDYARELADETGLMEDWPEAARSYFDWARWARDLRFDYTVADAPHGGGVYVFRNL